MAGAAVCVAADEGIGGSCAAQHKHTPAVAAVVAVGIGRVATDGDVVEVVVVAFDGVQATTIATCAVTAEGAVHHIEHTGARNAAATTRSSIAANFAVDNRGGQKADKYTAAPIGRVAIDAAVGDGERAPGKNTAARAGRRAARDAAAVEGQRASYVNPAPGSGAAVAHGQVVEGGNCAVGHFKNAIGASAINDAVVHAAAVDGDISCQIEIAGLGLVFA